MKQGDAATEKKSMDRYVVGLEDVEAARVPAVGGKAAHLAELSRVAGVRVPAGFCVTTHAFRRMLADAPSLIGPNGSLERLARLRPNDRTTLARSPPRSTRPSKRSRFLATLRTR